MEIKIVTQPITVGENEAFEQDVLGRKEFGESLLNLVSLSSDELVISLDGKWGEGKTTFVKMWQGLLDKEDIPNIYVNAFENDYSDDAFMAIAGAITAYVEEHKNKDEVKFDDLKKKAKSVGGQLLPWAAKVAIKTATLGVIKDSDIKELNDIKDDMAKGLSTVVDNFVGEKLESHKENLKVIQEFKNLLSEMSMSINSKRNNPLVIIIDELDRCKPTYALDLIEKVKHLFSVKNIVFVLVMNKDQLKKSVKCIYGEDIDAHAYLQKFINIETEIPKKTGSQYHNNDIAKYNKRLFELHKNEKWRADSIDISKYLEVLAKHFNLSLRELERAYTNLAVFYASYTGGEFKLSLILSFLAVIKVKEPSVYDALLHQRITYEELCHKTRLSDKEPEEMGGEKLQAIVWWIKFALITDEQFDQIDTYHPIRQCNTIVRSFGQSREDFVPYLAKKLNMFTVA